MNKINKKFCVILVLIMAICTACSSDTGQKDDDYMETSYHSLCESAEKLEFVSSVIYEAWHYGIYEDYYSVSELASEVGLPITSFTPEEVVNFPSHGTFSDCVWLVIGAMEREGYYSGISKKLDSAKDKLHKVSGESDEYTLLKEFYSSCLSYYEWVQSPTGSFDEMGDTKETYNKELKELKTKLSFYFG